MNKNLHSKGILLRFSTFLLVCLLFSGIKITAYGNELPEYNSMFAQQVKSATVTLKLQNKPLKTILYEIQKQTKINFMYNEVILKSFPNKSLDVKNMPVEKVLDQLLQDSGFTYSINKNNITIVKKTAPTVAGAVMNVRGKVVDKQKKPIVGATVLLAGTNKGAITSAEGIFNLPATMNQVVEVSYVGKKNASKVILDNKELHIVMEDDAMAVEDVVITGMFNKPKESYTGAVTFLSKQDLTNFKSRNLISTIANLDPSFNIVENNKMGSDPNALPEINIRGMTNLPQAGVTMGNLNDFQTEQRANLNTPLFILDGFEITLQRMMDLDEEEIENVTILKDASSTAIYGSRGTNGVVVITSVKPKAGKLTVNIKASLKLEVPDLSSYDLLNAREKLELETIAGLYTVDPTKEKDPVEKQLSLNKEYNRKLRSVQEGVDTYWLSQPLNTGIAGNYSLSLSGGDQSFRYSLSASYSGTQGVMIGSDRNNFNGSLNISYLYKSLSFSNVVSVGINTSHNTNYGTFDTYAKLNPYLTPYDDNGKITMYFGADMTNDENNKPLLNPLYDATTNTSNKNTYLNVRNNTSLEWSPIKSLKIGANVGFSTNTGENHNFKPPTHSSFDGVKDVTDKGMYIYGNNTSSSYNFALNMSYAEVFDKHSIFVGFNGTLSESTSSNFGTSIKGYTHENLDFISMGSKYGNTVPSGMEATSRAAGAVGNVNYVYDRALFVDASYRLDGASSFGDQNRFKPFYTVGAGWTVSRLTYIQDNMTWLNTMRLRYNYGVTGSLPFNVYDAFTIYEYNITQRYNGLIGANIKGYGNPNLTWQYTYSHNLGLDMDMLKSRISVGLNFYRRYTKGSITSMELPLSHGYDKYVENKGDILNTGYDFNVSVRLINDRKRQINWSVRASFASNKNKLVKLSEAMKTYSNDLKKRPQSKNLDPILLYEEGESMNALYAVRSLGIDPGSGKEIYMKRDGSVTYEYDNMDKIVVGVTQPKVQGSLSTSFRYKKLSVNLGFSLRLGGQKYNGTLVSKVENADVRQNVDRRVLNDRWRGIDHFAKHKGLTETQKIGQSTRFVQDESTLSCNTLNVAYTFSPKWVKKNLNISAMNISASTNDLFQISTIKLERGTNYPFARRINMSLSLTF